MRQNFIPREGLLRVIALAESWVRCARHSENGDFSYDPIARIEDLLDSAEEVIRYAGYSPYRIP